MDRIVVEATIENGTDPSSHIVCDALGECSSSTKGFLLSISCQW